MGIPLVALAMRPSAVREGFDVDRLTAIGRRMREFVGQGLVSGVVVRVMRHGKLVYEDAEGLASFEPRVPMHPETIFQIMSMTKPVTAVAVLQCVSDGRITLDDPLEKYFPAFRTARVKMPDGSLVPLKRKPTIRHLLTHTAGLGSEDPGGLDDDRKRKLTLAQYGDLLGSDPLIAQPGEAIHYSGPGFAALGRIVEIVTKMPLEEAMQKRIFEPLGMKDTFFFAPPSEYGRIATMYDRKDGRLVTVEPDPFRRGAKLANPAGGLYSTARDMGLLITAVAEHDRRLLPAAAIDTMTTLQTGSLPMDGGEAQGFGLGFAVVRSAEGQSTLKPFGAFGHTGAYGTEFWADRSRGIVAVYMAQSWENEPRKVFDTMVNAAFVGP